MEELFLLSYLLVISISFFCGATTAKSKRGRYLDKPIYDFVPSVIVKLFISIMGIISYFYLTYLNWKSVNMLLLGILLMFLIIISIVVILFAFADKIYKKFKKDDQEDNQDNKFYNDNTKEIVSIMDTAISNGSCIALIIFTIIIMILQICRIYFKCEEINLLFKEFSVGNLYILMLFNSFILFIFSVSKYCRYIFDNIKEKSSDDINNILKFIKDEVDN